MQITWNGNGVTRIKSALSNVKSAAEDSWKKATSKIVMKVIPEVSNAVSNYTGDKMGDILDKALLAVKICGVVYIIASSGAGPSKEPTDALTICIDSINITNNYYGGNQ